jgi:hypothetical protein
MKFKDSGFLCLQEHEVPGGMLATCSGVMSGRFIKEEHVQQILQISGR